MQTITPEMLLAAISRIKPPPRFLTVAEVAERYDVSEAKVLSWVRSGMLQAINVSDSSRPLWRFSPESLGEFELRRTVKTALPSGLMPCDPELSEYLDE